MALSPSNKKYVYFWVLGMFLMGDVVLGFQYAWELGIFILEYNLSVVFGKEGTNSKDCPQGVHTLIL